MITPITPEQRMIIDQLRDVVGTLADELFLHSLPSLLETQKIPAALAKNCLLFAQHAADDSPESIVTEALSILNQMIDPEMEVLLPPSQEMFIGRHFKWDELGGHKDSQSAIIHIINKCVTQLNLNRV